MKNKKMKRVQNNASNYTRTGNNIYFDGYSYRVRVSVDGVRYSRNFPTKKAAMEYRKRMLSEQLTHA
jgi:hypothetical protein